MQNLKGKIQKLVANNMVSRFVLLVWLLLITANGVGAQTSSTKDYCNHRFGFCISYDETLLTPMPKAYNGDGRVFKDKRGNNRLTVSGSGDWNFGVDGEVISLEQLYQKELKEYGSAVTYKVLGKTTFTISGNLGGKIFYRKVIKRDDSFCFASIQYAPAEAEQYKHMVGLIAKTFR